LIGRRVQWVPVRTVAEEEEEEEEEQEEEQAEK